MSSMSNMLKRAAITTTVSMAAFGQEAQKTEQQPQVIVDEQHAQDSKQTQGASAVATSDAKSVVILGDTKGSAPKSVAKAKKPVAKEQPKPQDQANKPQTVVVKGANGKIDLGIKVDVTSHSDASAAPVAAVEAQAPRAVIASNPAVVSDKPAVAPALPEAPKGYSQTNFIRRSIQVVPMREVVNETELNVTFTAIADIPVGNLVTEDGVIVLKNTDGTAVNGGSVHNRRANNVKDALVQSPSALEIIGGAVRNFGEGIGATYAGVGAYKYGVAAQDGKLQNIENISNTSSGNSTGATTVTTGATNVTATGGAGGNATSKSTSNGGTTNVTTKVTSNTQNNNNNDNNNTNVNKNSNNNKATADASAEAKAKADAEATAIAKQKQGQGQGQTQDQGQIQGQGQAQGQEGQGNGGDDCKDAKRPGKGGKKPVPTDDCNNG